jgi:cytochrome c biogenesis protein CcdA/thiol-disulfide isomerase/thioredoxin
MPLLLFFAILAGAGTALSPCVLPVLPALLSAGAVGGRRRPLGVVLGLSVTFTVTIVGVASLVDGVGLGADPLRYLAVAVLFLAGLTLMIPSVGDRLEARMSRLAALGPRSGGTGFRSGLLVGAALGFVYTPCAGPILSAVITISATSGRTVLVAIAYAFGSACVLLALTLGGRAVFERVRRAGRGVLLQRILGGVMVLTAIAILTGLDVEFDQYIAQHIPEVNLTASLQCSHTVTSRLHELGVHQSKLVLANGSAACGGSSSPVKVASRDASQASLIAIAEKLPEGGPAPEFTETQRWFNTPGDQPLSLASLRGRVVLVDFWTYTCINCIRTLPYLKAWYAAYHNQGLTIVGVETPEFAFEHEASNVADAVERFGIDYPVVQDNNYGTWDAYQNQYWPADYLIDSTGALRYATFGEGDYAKTETAIRALLALAGHHVGGMGHPRGVVVPSAEATPETYLGTNRAEGWVNGPIGGPHDYGPGRASGLAVNEFAYGGTWSIAAQPATAVSGASIDAEVQAKNVYLVLSSAGGRPRKIEVLLDGMPIPAADAGADVHDATVTVTSERLYTLVSLPSDQRHHLTLRLAPGISGYAFTFG